MIKLDILAYKVESFDTESFTEDIILFYPNSIVLVFNKDRIYLKYMPDGIKLRRELFRFTRVNNHNLNYYFYPLIFILDSIRLFLLFSTLFIRYKFRIVIVENTYAAFLISIFRRFNLMDRLIYLPGDWLAGNKSKRGIWSYFGSEIVFPFFDYFACKVSDLTADITETMRKARFRYWKMDISKNEIIYGTRFKLLINKRKSNCENLVFIGNIREDSGLELVISSLRSIRKHIGANLLIIGPPSEQERTLISLAKSNDVDAYINFKGFLERDKFKDVLSDSFCGINLITNETNYSSLTLPAKVCDYLQYLLPVVATWNLGFFANVISDNKLGLVINPTEEEFSKAVISIYNDQQVYRENISRFIESTAKFSIKDYIES